MRFSPIFLAEMASVKSCKIIFGWEFYAKIKFLGTNSRAKMAHLCPSIDFWIVSVVMKSVLEHTKLAVFQLAYMEKISGFMKTQF